MKKLLLLFALLLLSFNLNLAAEDSKPSEKAAAQTPAKEENLTAVLEAIPSLSVKTAELTEETVKKEAIEEKKEEAAAPAAPLVAATVLTPADETADVSGGLKDEIAARKEEAVLPAAEPAAKAVETSEQPAAVPVEAPKAEAPKAVTAAPAVEKTAEAPAVDSTAAQKTFTVWRIYNADILRLAEDEKLVLAGIDSPEYYLNRKTLDEVRQRKVSFKSSRWAGRKANEYSRYLAQGKKIRVELIPDDNGRDAHKRLVGYAFLEDGRFLNAELIKAGYARAVQRKGQEKYFQMFKTLQDEARAAGRGLWSNGYYQKIEPKQ